MNGTTVNATDPPPFRFNTSASNVVAATFVALLILLNLAGNIIVCVCFYCFRNLRTICNYFLISLCLADIFIALFGMPFWLVFQLTSDMEREWRFILSVEVYTFWTCMDILVGTASIINLAAVSFDRQLAITSPFSYPKVFTHARVIVLILAIWTYSIVISSMRAFAREFLGPAYILVVVVLSFFVPFVVMFVMYARIYYVAKSQAQRMGGNIAHDLKAAKTIAIVIGTFLICWAPFFLYNFSVYIYVCCYITYYNQVIMIPALQAVKWMAYFNSCLNPLIYTVLNRPYRRAFKKLIARCWNHGDYLDKQVTTRTCRNSTPSKKNNGETGIEFITNNFDSSDNVKKSLVTYLRSPKMSRNV